MALEYDFSGRDKLVKGQSYPIKRGDLDAALESAGVTEIKYVSFTCYVGKKGDDKEQILSATFSGEARTPGLWQKMIPSINVNSVPSHFSQEIKSLVRKQDTLALLGNWLKELEGANSVRRDQRQTFYAFFSNGKIIIDAT